MKDIKKNQMKVLEMEATICQMNYILDGLIGDQTFQKKKIRGLADIAMQTTKIKHRKKR